MSMTDPIADLLTRIRNALMRGHEKVEAPDSKRHRKIVEILKEEGYISGFKVEEKNLFSFIVVQLKYTANREPAIRVIRRVSKPGRRVYAGKGEIPKVLAGMGINIISTSQGIMTGKKAFEQGIGGEILCEVY